VHLYPRNNTKIQVYNTQNSYIIILRFPMLWNSAYNTSWLDQNLSRRCLKVLSIGRNNMIRLENVAIANALQLEATRATPAISRFTPWTWPLTLWLWPLTFDIEHLQRIACDVMKLYNKFERNRTIIGGVNANFSVWH